MLTLDERRLVEAIKEAPMVLLRISTPKETVDVRVSSKKCKHDIALAIQSDILNRK